MKIDFYILAFSAFTVAVTIWMGFRSAKKSKTASDFFVAGRSVSVGWNASAISGEYLSAASFMGIAGMVMSSGYDALWYPVCYACGYLFLLLFIAGPLRRFGAYTIPDFAEGRFDSPVFRKIAVVFVLFIGFFYTMPQMKGAGVTLAYIFPGLPYWVGVVLVGAVITLNVALGGMKGITLVQAFQYWAKMFAISVPIFILMAVYGHYGKQVGANAHGETDWTAVRKDWPLNGRPLPEGLERIKSDPGEQPKVSAEFVGVPIELLVLEDIRLQEALAHYEKAVGRRAFVATRIAKREVTFREEVSAYGDPDTAFAAGLSKNGIALIASEQRIVFAVPKDTEQATRRLLAGFGLTIKGFQPFPAKAPADSTWLNPFGPLTTKAAKTAAAAIGKKAAASAQFDNQSEKFALDLKSEALPDVAQMLTNTIQAPPMSLTPAHGSGGRGSALILTSPKSAVELLLNPNLIPTSNLQFVAESKSRSLFVRIGDRNVKVPDAAASVVFNRQLRRLENTDSGKGTQRSSLPAEATSISRKGVKESRDTIALRPGLSPDQRMTVALDSPTVAQALGVYAELTGRQLLPNTNSFAERADDLLGGKLSALKIITRPPAPDSGVREHGDGMFTAAEVKAAIETQLRTNGLALVPVGKSGFQVTKRPADPTYWGGDSNTTANGVTANLRDAVPEVSDGTAGLSDAVAEVRDATAGFSGGVTEVRRRTTEVRDGTAGFSDRTAGFSGRVAGVRDDVPEPSRRAAKPVLLAAAGPNPVVEAAPRSAEASAATIGAAAEKAWLAKHEKPLALLYTYSLIIAIVCGTAGLPHILVRFYTNPDGAAAKRTTMWVMILIGVFYVFPPVFGALGRNLMPDLYTGLAGIKGTDQVVLKLPVLLNEKYPPLGSILSGITCAGAFAAFMSTFSGLLVSMTGALAHDVYGRILRPKSTPEQRMRMFKIGAVLIGGVAVLLGSFVEPLEINFMVGQAFAIAAASYFPLLFMAVWWRKLTMKGAAIGMLTGGVCALAAATLTNFSNLALDKGPMGKLFAGFAPLNNYWADHPLLRILCEQPAIWAVPLALTLMVVVSKLTAKSIPEDIRMKMLVLHAPEELGLKQEYIQEHQPGH